MGGIRDDLRDAGRPQRPEGEPECYGSTGTFTDLARCVGDISICPGSNDTLYPVHEWGSEVVGRDEDERAVVQCSQCFQHATEPDERQWMRELCPDCRAAWIDPDHFCCALCWDRREDDRQHDMDEQRLREGA